MENQSSGFLSSLHQKQLHSTRNRLQRLTEAFQITSDVTVPPASVEEPWMQTFNLTVVDLKVYKFIY